MSGVAQGYGLIGMLIAVGVILAHLNLIDAAVERALSAVVYMVATPALLFDLMARTELSAAIGQTLVVGMVSAMVIVCIYAAVARRILRNSAADVTVGCLSASYVNSVNLGVPIAAYVLGDPSFVIPVLLMQPLLMAPGALAVLGASTSGQQARLLSLVISGLRNPVSISAVCGIALAHSGLGMPIAVSGPISVLGQMAVPGALLAFGVSLRLGPKIGNSGMVRLSLICLLKAAAQPLIAYGLGRYVLGLDHHVLYGVTVMAALPTGQIVFVYASRFSSGVGLARDSIVVTTLVSVPSIAVIATLLG